MIIKKHGWIRIVEAMTAILLISGVVLIAIGQNQRTRQDISQKVYPLENAMLTQVQLNESARAEIIGVPSGALPVPWSQFSTFAPNTMSIIKQNSPSSMKCQGRICETKDICVLEKQNVPNQTVYSQSAIITANLTSYNPLLLKIFCW